MSGENMNGKPTHYTDDAHTATQDRLAAYATAAVLGLDLESMYSEVREHLAQCPYCRADLAELFEMTRMLYEATLPTAKVSPQPDLSFLRPPTEKQVTAQPWLIDAIGRLVVQFSEDLLARLQTPGLLGATRGQRLYHYEQESGSLQDVHVTIDVFAEDAKQEPAGLVRVLVEVSSLDPFDQSGSRVTVRAGEQRWEGETDETGSVDFASVPLEMIPRLRVEIDPRRE